VPLGVVWGVGLGVGVARSVGSGVGLEVGASVPGRIVGEIVRITGGVVSHAMTKTAATRVATARKTDQNIKCKIDATTEIASPARVGNVPATSMTAPLSILLLPE
jgi:hypothetical protein